MFLFSIRHLNIFIIVLKAFSAYSITAAISGSFGIFFSCRLFLLNVGHCEYYVTEQLKFFLPVKSVELCFG